MGAMPFTLTTSGSVQATPSPSSAVDGSALLGSSVDLASTDTFDAVFAGNLPIAGTLALALGAVVAVRYVSVRAVDGQSLTVSITSGRGVALVPVSDLLVVRARNAGDEISAVSISGNGRVEYIIGGNKS